MRIYELRIYFLRDMAALRQYSERVYPRHLASFPKFGVEPHGFWTEKEGSEPKLLVLVSYPEGADPKEIERRYLSSPELAEDVRDFDVSAIRAVDTTLLVPSIGSPLS